MFAFKKVFASVFLAVLCASTANAVPYPLTKYATHRTREISADLKLEAYHRSSFYETFGEGIDHPLSKRADASLEDSATAFVQSRVGVDAEEVHLRSKTANEATNIVYFKQRVNGVPVANAVANVAFNKNNKLNSVHGIGEVLANILHNVYAALVDEHGFADDARTNPSSSAGNVVYFHLFDDALQLQPCSPTFISARDAWIQADVNRYGGANK